MTPSLREVLRTPRLFGRLCRIYNQQKQLVPLEYNAVQLRYEQERTVRDIILKARQQGFTTFIQAELHRYRMTRTAATLTIMEKGENTKAVRGIASTLYTNFPANITDNDGTAYSVPYLVTDNATDASWSNGSISVMVSAGAKTAGRGSAYTHMHGSEVAFWPDAQNIVKSAFQAGDLKGIWLESTANGAQGWFYETFKRAMDGDKAWRPHFFPWFASEKYQIPLLPDERIDLTNEEGQLVERHNLTMPQIKWRRVKIASMSGIMSDFLQEYPEDVESAFAVSGESYFGRDIDQFFTAPMNAVFDPTHEYVAGLDFGQQRDYTVLYVLDATTKRFVAILRVRHEDWREMRAQIVDYARHWNIQMIRAESNAMGVSEIESLRNDLNDASLETAVWSFAMTASSKPNLMRTYRTAMYEGGLRHPPYPVVRAELKAAKRKLTAQGWTVESPRDEKTSDGELMGHGDTVVAGALAWLAAMGFVD